MEALKKNKILIIVFLITTAAFVYYFFFSGSSDSDVSVSDTTTTDNATGQEILDMLARVDAIKIDDTLFSGAVWNTLRDLSATLPTNPAGRTDLFGPLGQTGSAAASSKTTVTKKQ